MPVSASAGHQPRPHRDRVRCVRLHRWNSKEQKRGKSDETASARYSIQDASQGGGTYENDGLVKLQALVSKPRDGS